MKNVDDLLYKLSEELSSGIISNLQEGAIQDRAISMLKENREVYLKQYGRAAYHEAVLYIYKYERGQS